jgi:hypothetical protein
LCCNVTSNRSDVGTFSGNWLLRLTICTLVLNCKLVCVCVCLGLGSKIVVVDGSLFFPQNTFVGMYATLHEVWKQAASRYKPFLKSWKYHITHYTTGLVGFLSTSVCNGYWSLSDATHTIPCVFTGNMEDLVTLHGTVLLLLKYTLVTEVCQVRDTWGLTAHTVRCLTKFHVRCLLL